LPRHESGFLSHLEELRKRIIVSFLCFFAASVAAYFFSGTILDFLITPLARFQNSQLYFQKPYEAFLTHIKVAAFAGFVFSLPVLITQGWLFVSPGLFGHEKIIAALLSLICLFLFLVGAGFAYWVVVPWGIHFLLEFQTESLKPLLGIGPYLSFLTGMIVAFGLLFDFPVVLIGLVRLGATNTNVLAKGRKIVIVVIFITAAILTPSPDPISQLLLAVPLILLFELSLVVARLVEGKKAD